MPDKKDSEKNVSRSLRQDWAQALLGGNNEALWSAQENLKAEVGKCREVLERNPLSPLVAKAFLQEAGLEGDGTVVMDNLGVIQVDLVMAQEKTVEKTKVKTTPAEEVKETKKPPVVETEKPSKLPLIGELRKQADVLDLDWKPFGKSRTKLQAAIQEKQASGASNAPSATPEPDPPKKKMMNTAPALSPVTVVTPDPEPVKEADPVPLPQPEVLPFGPNTGLPTDIGDETPEDTPPPSDLPQVKKGKPKVDLKALAKMSEELDIDDLIKDLSPEEAEATPEE